MQIAILVGHRPRPPSSSGAPLFPSFFFSFFPIFSRSGVVAGAQTTRIEQRLAQQVRGVACMRAMCAEVGNGYWNSISAVLPRRWIVRANRDGL